MLNDIFLPKICSFIEHEDLLPKEKKHLVALSGGADSVCLFHVLKQLGYDFDAAHCNFQLRGQDSDDDEIFCKELCKAHNIILHSIKFNTKQFAKEHNQSIEMAARELRYNYFQSLVTSCNLNMICVAHHQNDNVETILHNMTRGTGLKGLRGIMPKRDNIVRPLLCVNRQEIEKFLISNNIKHCQDKTNFEDDFSRNRLRLNVIPQLEIINSAALDNIEKTAKIAIESERFIERQIEQIRKENCQYTNGKEIYSNAAIEDRFICYRLFCFYGFNSHQCNDIFNAINHKKTGDIFYSHTHALLIDRQSVIVKLLNNKEDVSILLQNNGEYSVTEKETIVIETHSNTNKDYYQSNKNICFIDKQTVKFPLLLRRVKQGDKFIPFGMKNYKLVSDYLTDRKKTLFEKEEQLVVEDNNRNIVWLVNERADERTRIRENTDEIIIIKYCRSK